MFGKVIAGVIGLSSGLMIAAGVFTVLLTVGLIPRFAGKTHTGSKVQFYENAVILGTIAGNIISVYSISVPLGKIGGSLFGLGAGIFVGSLAIAIAEMLDGIPISIRRIKLKKGLGLAILSMALGKGIGSFIYFFNRW